MTALPKQYAWLAFEPGPRLLTEFLKVFGTAEKVGPGSNPTILQWAKTIGLEKVYRDDATAWCGLVMGYVALQAGWDGAPKGNALWARNWAHWGNGVSIIASAELGDILVFPRGTGGHVGMYVGEDTTHYHVLGGNQSDAVNIRRKPKKPIIAVRRCPWRINQPANVRRVFLAATGKPSTDEA
jgi:uncharacterized protein (TIGR02594 family)